MKLGVNNDVNSGTKKVGIRLMDGWPPRINPPNSHPSNPIHKAAMAAQEPKPASKEKKITADEEPVSEKTVSEPYVSNTPKLSRFVRGTLRFDSNRTESIRTTGSQDP